ncbi:DoxX family protein [Mycobacterium sp.]|uniref:DoxX family protein n=1 Tax=Mycobacterium sp. TaxID=1785 RepID=UPI0031E47BAC
MNQRLTWRDWAVAGVRIVFGIIWAVDAWLKWQPGFRATFLPNMISTAAAEPHWLNWWFDVVLALERPAPALFAYIGAVTETLLAIVLVLGLARRLAFAGGALYSLAIWCTADGFGAPYGPGATDIGPGIVYAMVFVTLLVMLEHGHSSHLAVDAAIAPRVPWWSLLSGPLNRDSVPSRP